MSDLSLLTGKRVLTSWDFCQVLDSRRRAFALNAKLRVVEAQEARSDDTHAREHRLRLLECQRRSTRAAEVLRKYLEQ